MDTLKEKIKYYREKKNISKSKLAQEIGVSPSYITRLENGEKKSPSLDIKFKLANVLNIPISELSDNVEPDDFKEIKDMLLKEKTKFRVDNANNNFILTRIDKLQSKISETVMYTDSDIETLLNEISFILKRKDARMSLNMLKDYISSKDYDINKFSDESLIDIDKKFSDILELEFYKLNK